MQMGPIYDNVKNAPNIETWYKSHTVCIEIKNLCSVWMGELKAAQCEVFVRGEEYMIE